MLLSIRCSQKNFEQFKKCLSVFLLSILFISNFLYVKVGAQSSNDFIFSSETISNKVPNEAKKFAKDNYQDVVAIVNDYLDSFVININDLNDIKLEKPYIVYDFNSTTFSYGNSVYRWRYTLSLV